MCTWQEQTWLYSHTKIVPIVPLLHSHHHWQPLRNIFKPALCSENVKISISTRNKFELGNPKNATAFQKLQWAERKWEYDTKSVGIAAPRLKLICAAFKWLINVLKWGINVLKWGINALKWWISVLKLWINALKWWINVLKRLINTLKWVVNALKQGINALKWEINVLK